MTRPHHPVISSGLDGRMIPLIAMLLIQAGADSARALRAEPAGSATPRAGATPGAFHLTAAQFRTLTVETLRVSTFEDSLVTDGRIGVDADHSTPVFCAHTGRVTQVLVRAGDRVVRGQALARVESAEYAQALGELRSTAAQLALARSAAQRKHEMLQVRGAALQDVEQAEADLTAASAAHEAARTRLRSLGATDADLDPPAASSSNASAAEGVAAAVIRAPVSGVVTDRQLAPGQFVQAGSATALFTVSDGGSVWLWANVRESDAARVRVGQRVDAEVPALARQRLSGRLDFVAAGIDAATHRLAVRATLVNHDGLLKPDMLATVRVHLGGERQSPAVPDSAIVRDGAAARVWVVAPDGSLSARTLQLGRRSGADVEVTAGLRAGERIVTRGALFVDAAGQAP